MDAAPGPAPAAEAGARRPPLPPDLAAALCGLALLALLAVLPAVGPVVAWPLLFGLPGTLLAARAVPGLGAPGRLGVGILVSVLVSAHLTFLLALALGFRQVTLLLAVAVLMAASWVLATRPLPSLGPPPPGWSAAAMQGLWERHRPAWLTAGALALATGATLEQTLLHHIDGGYKSGAANWSDFLLHVSIGASIQSGNFPPQVPFFAGEPLTYHYFGDLHSAIAAALSTVALPGVMGFSTTLLVGALALVVYELTWQLCGRPQAGVAAAVLTVLGGGLGWIKLPADLLHGKGDLLTLLHTQQYDFDGSQGFPHFVIPPVFEVGLLVQRATTYGLPVLVAVGLVAWLSWGRSPAGVLLAGVMAALLAPFNFFALPVAYLVLALVAVERRFWRHRGWFDGLLLLALPAVYAASFLIRPILLKSGAGHIQLVRGWQDSPLDEGALGIAFFYLTNLGVPFVLALVALLMRRTPARLLLAGWIAILVAVPNVIQVSAVSFDSSKFFQLLWPAVAILAALLMRTWHRLAIVPLIAISCVAGLMGAVWAFGDTRLALDDAQYAAAQWISGNTPDGAVFVTPSFINMPTDLAGRLRLTGFFTYSSDYGYDQTQRDADVVTVYCGGDVEAAAVMHLYAASYVLDQGFNCAPQPRGTDFGHSPLFEQVYGAGGVTIYRLRP